MTHAPGARTDLTAMAASAFLAASAARANSAAMAAAVTGYVLDGEHEPLCLTPADLILVARVALVDLARVLADASDPAVQHATAREVLRIVCLQDSSCKPRSASSWGCGAGADGSPCFGGEGGYFEGLQLSQQPPCVIQRWIDAFPHNPDLQDSGRAELQRRVVLRLTECPRDTRVLEWGLAQLAWLCARPRTLEAIERRSGFLPMCSVLVDAVEHHLGNSAVYLKAVQLLRQLLQRVLHPDVQASEPCETAVPSIDQILPLTTRLAKAALGVVCVEGRSDESSEIDAASVDLVEFLYQLVPMPASLDPDTILACMRAACATKQLASAAERLCAHLRTLRCLVPELPHKEETMRLLVRTMHASPKSLMLHEIGIHTLDRATQQAEVASARGGFESFRLQRKKSEQKLQEQGSPSKSRRTPKPRTMDLASVLLDAAAKEGALSAVNAAEAAFPHSVPIVEAAQRLRERLLGRQRFATWDAAYKGRYQVVHMDKRPVKGRSVPRRVHG